MCKEEKELDQFYNSKVYPGGKSYRCKSCDAASGKAYRLRHIKRDQQNRRVAQRKCKYGVTPEKFNDLWESQNGKCAICNTKLSDVIEIAHRHNKAVIDHCHKTGIVRGLLCTMCNKGIGLLKDDSENLKRALKYLNKIH